jgi:uncharacterized protein (DUF302 family)
MYTYNRHVVVAQDFDVTLLELMQALHDEGLAIVSRIDVREQLQRTLGTSFKRHLVFDAWSPYLAMNAIREELETGTFIMTRIVIYELGDGETVVAVTDGLSSLLADSAYRLAHPKLASLSERERERASRVLSRIEQPRGGELSPAA